MLIFVHVIGSEFLIEFNSSFNSGISQYLALSALNIYTGNLALHPSIIVLRCIHFNRMPMPMQMPININESLLRESVFIVLPFGTT